MNTNNWIFTIFFICSLFIDFNISFAKEETSKKSKLTKIKSTNTKNNTDKKRKKEKTTTNDINSKVIRSLTDELEFLNKKLAPRLQEKEALNYMKSKKNKKAIDLLESLEDSSPRSLLILAQAYENQEDYNNQIRILRKLTKKYKENGHYALELAKGLRKLYFKTALFEYRTEAIKIIDQVLTMNKKYHERAYLETLELLKYKEDFEETSYTILKLLQTLIREYGIKRTYIKDICKYFYINKFYGQSLSGCKKAMRYDPKEPSNYVYYALSMKEPKDQEKHLKKSAKKFPKSALIQTKTGQFFTEQKDYESALPYFKQAVNIKKNSAEARLGLAQSLFYTGKEKQSYKHFLKACLLDKQKMLWFFKQAKSILNQKNKFKLGTSFQKGITRCFIKAKKN